MGLWGGEHRRRASLTFGLLMAGSGLVMLLVILVCYHTHFIQTGSPSFDTRHWEGLVLTPVTETWLFWGLFLAFAVQTPLFPFHFWLSGIAQESPMAGKLFASAILLKIGAYGLFRFTIPWFPRAAWTYAPTVMTLAAVSLLVGGIAALVSDDARKFLARVTMAHMALVVMGLFSFVAGGVKGALVLALAHSFFMGGLIIVMEWVQDELGVFIKDMWGLRGIMPVGWVITLLLSAGALGIPVFHGIEIVRGGMTREPVQAVATGVALTVLAVAFLRLALKTLGKKEDGYKKDLHRREILILLPLVLLVIWIGIAPGGVLRALDPAARAFVSRVSDQVVLTE
jgi:NADH-quinone oxidoreductase subunit M